MGRLLFPVACVLGFTCCTYLFLAQQNDAMLLEPFPHLDVADTAVDLSGSGGPPDDHIGRRLHRVSSADTLPNDPEISKPSTSQPNVGRHSTGESNTLSGAFVIENATSLLEEQQARLVFLYGNDDPETVRAKARSSHHCNTPTIATSGEEGIVEPGFKLVHVHVLIRHGQRSPMSANPLLKDYINNSLCSVRKAARLAQSQLTNPDRSQLQLKREPLILEGVHANLTLLALYIQEMELIFSTLGYRNTARRYGLYPHAAACQGAHLTGFGAWQHLNLGLHLRDIYINKWNLFRDNYQPNRINTQTTGYSRTYQSAIALLFGLLPDFRMQYTHFNFSKSVYFCSTKLSGISCHCPAVNNLDFNTPATRNEREDLETVKQEFSDIFGFQRGDVSYVKSFLDNLYNNICTQLPLPCSRNDTQRCVTWPLVGQAWDVLDEKKSRETRNWAREKHGRLIMHPLLVEINSRMRRSSEKQEFTRFVLYSGHDMTMDAMSQALGISDHRFVKFAARIVFELYRTTGREPRSFYIRVLYNGQDVTSQVRFCQDEPLVRGLCPLEKFDKFVKSDNVQKYGTGYWDACHQN